MASALNASLSLSLASLLLVLFCCSADAHSDLALDCCLQVSRKPVPRHVILGYRQQTRGEGCSRDAVIFTTRKGLNLCAPAASEEQWVKEMTVFLDARLKKCKESMFVGKRCQALKRLLA